MGMEKQTFIRNGECCVIENIDIDLEVLLSSCEVRKI